MKHILQIHLGAFATLSLLTALAAPVQAQVATGEQLLSRFGINPTVAADGRNGFVLGWQDGDVPHSSGIFAATLPPGASAPRKPFQVNTTTAGNQLFPDVAADAEGRFVFVWQNGALPNDVRGQTFRAGGGRQSPEVRLAASSESDQLAAQVAMEEGGDFVVAWVDDHLQRGAIKAARFSGDGSPLGGEINLKAQGMENNAARVAAFPGGFAVGWSEIYDCHQGAPGGFVGAVGRFDSAGQRLGPVFRVGTPACFGPTPAGVLVALVGSQAGALALFYNGPSLLVQRFAATGEPTAQFRVPFPPCTQDHCALPAALTMDDSGRFAMIWENDDLNRLSLSVQIFNPRGKPLTGRIAVSDDTSGSFETPAAALADDGTLAVVWRREVGSVPATDGLFLRRIVLGGKAGD